MTITCVTFIVGFIVPIEKYQVAVCGDDEDNREKVYDDIAISYEPLYITLDQRSDVLLSKALPHDKYNGSMVIGVLIMQPNFAETNYEGEEFPGNDLTEAFTEAITKIDPAIKTVKNELENIKEINPALYELLKDRKINLLALPDDCNCCS